jgi:hypothetical protein
MISIGSPVRISLRRHPMNKGTTKSTLAEYLIPLFVNEEQKQFIQIKTDRTDYRVPVDQNLTNGTSAFEPPYIL